MKNKLKTIVQFILNPRLLFCFGVAWIITNGWSYIVFALGTLLGIEWMVIVSSAYLTFLWIPFTPEKIVTVIIAIGLLRFLFPNDKKTLGVLIDAKNNLIRKFNEKRRKSTSDRNKKREQRKITFRRHINNSKRSCQ